MIFMIDYDFFDKRGNRIYEMATHGLNTTWAIQVSLLPEGGLVIVLLATWHIAPAKRACQAASGCFFVLFG